MLQTALKMIYPSQCLGCGGLVEGDGGLCGPCWRDTPFISGSACMKCGTPLMGDAPGDDTALCDDCMATPRPWDRGAAALVYHEKARGLVLALKYGDRQDLVAPAAGWMLARGRPLLEPGMIAVPVPLHWRRLARRRYNQAALLARRIARDAGLDFLPDALLRTRHTETQDRKTIDQRFENQHAAIRVHPKRASRLANASVLLVDDVMTSGATLGAAAEVLRAAGTRRVNVLTLARVAKDF